MTVRTEGQPGLSDLQVHREIRLQAQIPDGDVGAGFSFQRGVLHVAVENTWNHSCTLGENVWATVIFIFREP